MKYFLIVYNRLSGQSSVRHVFDADDRAEAMQSRFELEDEFRSSPEMEIVVLGADSQETLLRTHSRYFKSAKDMILQVNAPAG